MTVHHSPADVRSATDSDGLLRLALRLDAVASGALGLLAVAAAPALDDLLGIEPSVLRPIGIFLVLFAAAVAVIASRPRIGPAAAWTVIGVNALWVIDSVAVVATGWLDLTGLGIAFVLVQAAAVAFFADLQFMGLRRTR